MTLADLGISVTSNADKAAVDLDKLVAASSRAETGAKRLSSSSDGATAALRREATATQELAVGLQRTAASGGFMTANLAQQAQDVVVAAQMGQSAIQVGLQQGMQAASVIQMLRSQGMSTSGALVSAIGSLISPVNLLTIGLVTLGAVGIQSLMAIAPQAESATDAIERHGDALKEVVEGYDAAGEAVDDYIASANRLPRGLAQDQIVRQFADIRRETEEFRLEMESFGSSQMFAKYGSEAVLTLQSLARQFAAGEMPAEDFYTAIGNVSSQLTLLERAGAAIPGSTQSMIGSFQEGALKALAFGSAIDQLIASTHALAGTGWNEGVSTALGSKLESERSAVSHQVELDAINAKSPAQQRDIAMRRERLKLVDEEITEALREQKVREAGEVAFAKASAKAGKAATKDFDEWGNSQASFQLRIDQAESEIELFGRGIFEIERQKAALELLADAKRAGVPATAELADEIDALAISYADAQLQLEALQLNMENETPWETLARHIEKIDLLMGKSGLSAQAYAMEMAKAIEKTVGAYTTAIGGILGSFDKFEDARAMQSAEELARQRDYVDSLEEGSAAKEAAEKDYADAVEAEGRRAFESEKQLSIARAILSGGEAIAKSYTWGTTLGGPIGGAIAAGLAAAATAAQIAAIAGTSYHSKTPVTSRSTGGASSQGSSADSGASQAVTLVLKGKQDSSTEELADRLAELMKDGGGNRLITVLREAA